MMNLDAQINTHLLELYRLEFQDMSHWAKTIALAGLRFLLEVLGKNPFSWLFQLPEAAHISWLRDPFF